MSEIIADWQANLADPSVRFTFLRKERDRHHDTPRVAVIPVDGTFESPDRIGRQDLPDGATRTLFDDHGKYFVECWADDYDAAKDLMYRVVNAIRLSNLGACKLIGYSWVSQEEGIAGDDIRGECARIELTVIEPVTDAKKTLAVPFFVFPCKIEWKPPTYGIGLTYGSGCVYGPGEAVCCD